ncbi:hypothetical protein HY485_00955 [Candidatus Woesearchaeota archaeon]|nr:hypothetical protein [Candidatus Woesearchaeota archaeon]
MASFEEIVSAYKTASQHFVNTNEELLVKDLQEIYDSRDDDFFFRVGFSKQDLAECGIDGLVSKQKHPALGRFYEMFSEGLYSSVVSKTWADEEMNKLSGQHFGFRPADERTDLECEIEMNSHLSVEKLVEHLMKLRGPFGTRALYVCKEGGSTPFAGVPPFLYTVILMQLCHTACGLLRATEINDYENRKNDSKDSPPDIDAETDF